MLGLLVAHGLQILDANTGAMLRNFDTSDQLTITEETNGGSLVHLKWTFLTMTVDADSIHSLPPLTIVGAGKLGMAVAEAWQRHGGRWGLVSPRASHGPQRVWCLKQPHLKPLLTM